MFKSNMMVNIINQSLLQERGESCWNMYSSNQDMTHCVQHFNVGSDMLGLQLMIF